MLVQACNFVVGHSVCRFSFDPSTPPRCPKRSSAAPREGPPAKCTQRRSQNNGQKATAQSTTSVLPAAAEPTLPADLLEKIVSIVTTEVTKQLTPLLIPASQSTPPNSQLLDEVSACTPRDMFVAGVDSPSLLTAAAVVSDSVNAVKPLSQVSFCQQPHQHHHHQALYFPLPAFQLILKFPLN